MEIKSLNLSFVTVNLNLHLNNINASQNNHQQIRCCPRHHVKKDASYWEFLSFHWDSFKRTAWKLVLRNVEMLENITEGAAESHLKGANKPECLKPRFSKTSKARILDVISQKACRSAHRQMPRERMTPRHIWVWVASLTALILKDYAEESHYA